MVYVWVFRSCLEGIRVLPGIYVSATRSRVLFESCNIMVKYLGGSDSSSQRSLFQFDESDGT